MYWTRKSIGTTIVPGSGFIPNKNYHLYTGDESRDEITVLEYEQYALICEIAKNICTALENSFPGDRASQSFVYVVILYANGLVQVNLLIDGKIHENGKAGKQLETQECEKAGFPDLKQRGFEPKSVGKDS